MMIAHSKVHACDWAIPKRMSIGLLSGIITTRLFQFLFQFCILHWQSCHKGRKNPTKFQNALNLIVFDDSRGRMSVSANIEKRFQKTYNRKKHCVVSHDYLLFLTISHEINMADQRQKMPGRGRA